jgi:hypothetical protein
MSRQSGHNHDLCVFVTVKKEQMGSDARNHDLHLRQVRGTAPPHAIRSDPLKGDQDHTSADSADPLIVCR